MQGMCGRVEQQLQCPQLSASVRRAALQRLEQQVDAADAAELEAMARDPCLTENANIAASALSVLRRVEAESPNCSDDDYAEDILLLLGMLSLPWLCNTATGTYMPVPQGATRPLEGHVRGAADGDRRAAGAAGRGAQGGAAGACGTSLCPCAQFTDLRPTCPAPTH